MHFIKIILYYLFQLDLHISNEFVNCHRILILSKMQISVFQILMLHELYYNKA